MVNQIEYGAYDFVNPGFLLAACSRREPVRTRAGLTTVGTFAYPGPAHHCVGGKPAILRGSTLEQVQRDVDDHVFLPANHAAPAQFDQYVQSLEAVPGGGIFGMPQEA